MNVAFVAPGGRDVKGGEDEPDEWDERIQYLMDLAELSGGEFIHIEK